MSAALLEYLQGQQGIAFKRLYKQPSTVLAVLRRMLPHLAKTIVMAMLYMPEPFLENDLYTWIRPDCRAERDEAMAVLDKLHILAVVPEPAVPRAYRLSPSFSLSLRRALTGGGDHRSFGVPCSKPDPNKMSVQALDDWARGKWEAILYYMVGTTDHSPAIRTASLTQGTITLLQMGGFVQRIGGRTSITKDGFTFLLQEANTQVWSLLIVYLENCEEVREALRTARQQDRDNNIAKQLKMDPVDVLSFLFMLGSLELGQDYSTASLTPTQSQMLDDLSDFGIVYRHSNDSSRFYPTRLATTLTSDAGALLASPVTGANSLTTEPNAPQSTTQKGYIILETNHRVYAYTTSELQVRILALFTKLHTRFPNLISGIITKSSINRAISLGITSAQIISYLTTHAHPQMLKQAPTLPPTVVDQIRLWQLEENRMRATTGFLMNEFGNWREFEEAAKYAEMLGVLVWRKEEKRCFFVNQGGIEQMAKFLQGKKAQGQGQGQGSKG